MAFLEGHWHEAFNVGTVSSKGPQNMGGGAIAKPPIFQPGKKFRKGWGSHMFVFSAGAEDHGMLRRIQIQPDVSDAFRSKSGSSLASSVLCHERRG
jgi:hypothetical protein